MQLLIETIAENIYGDRIHICLTEPSPKPAEQLLCPFYRFKEVESYFQNQITSKEQSGFEPKSRTREHEFVNTIIFKGISKSSWQNGMFILLQKKLK